MGIIYLAWNKVNSKGYVGKTIRSFQERRKEHEEAAVNNAPWILSCAIRKYGFDAFEWLVLYEDEDEDREWMDWLEKGFIKRLKTKVPNGYNMTDGGEGGNHGGWKHTEETKQKMREIKIGTTLSEDTKKKISEWNKGKIISEETREKISKANSGRICSEETKKKLSEIKKGKKLTAETCAKMSASKRGKQIVNGKYVDRKKRPVGFGF